MTTLNSFVKRTLLAAVMLGVLLVQVPANAASPVNSNAPTISLTASLAESISITASGTVNFPLVDGSTVNGSAGVPVTTSWVLASSRSTVKLYGFFASSTAALNDLPLTDVIPSADVLGYLNSGTATAFSQTAPFGGASAGLTLFTQSLTGGPFVGSRTDTLNLQIAVPATLPAGSYTGTLTLEAQAN